MAASWIHGELLHCEQTARCETPLRAGRVIQTALIGSLASIGLDDKTQAIATIIVPAAYMTPPQLLAFVMPWAWDDQADIGVANGLSSTFRLTGGTVATPVYTAILSHRLTSELLRTMVPVLSSSQMVFQRPVLPRCCDVLR